MSVTKYRFLVLPARYSTVREGLNLPVELVGLQFAALPACYSTVRERLNLPVELAGLQHAMFSA